MFFSEIAGSEARYDAILVGGGIMSATLAVLLNELEPEMRILIIERLSSPALESSAAINNAGTGHAANCELNYTPIEPNGLIKTEKALSINKSFEQSLEFWASLTLMGRLNPKDFIKVVPHISFVWGQENVSFLHKRFQQLRCFKAFERMEWSNDSIELKNWIPLIMEGRNPNEILAATRVKRGTDIDFGSLTSAYFESLRNNSFIHIKYKTEVVDLEKYKDEDWHLNLKAKNETYNVQAPFVFLGAGGGALSLLQKSSIPEAQSYGGFPVSGQWLTCTKPDLVHKHHGKVYGKAKVGSPPMSVPHLDSRWISGKRSLLFGPFAGFSTKFLKQGSNLDLFRSVTLTNLKPMLQVGIKNFDLVKYLFNQVSQSHEDRINALKEFCPTSDPKDWKLSIAGQRVQIIKITKKGSSLQMGTEVVTSKDGSLAALLGASPGASTAVSIMLEILKRCWPMKIESDNWRNHFKKLFPSSGFSSQSEYELLQKMRNRTDSLLNLQ